MGIFISVPKTIECVVTALAFAVFLSLAVYRQAGVLQSSGYSNKKYFQWLKKKGNLAFERFALLSLICVMTSAVTALCFSFTGEWAAVISLAPYLLFFIVYLAADKKIALRSKTVFTPRLKRLYVVLVLVFAVVSYLLVTLLNFAAHVWENELFFCVRYVPLFVLQLLALPMLMLANAISKIYEIPHNKKFVRAAKNKLKNSDIKVVGITGSYGKTSTKFILGEMLSQKFRVLTTPASHNTPLGLALAVNNNELSDYDIFIAEMGARHSGDIAELCEICPPDVSLITGICGQHMESFKTFANLIKAKSEILSYTKDTAVIADDCYALFAEYSCPKIRCDCVSEVECSSEGTAFTLTLGGESRRAETKLLGRHSAYNIGLAAEAAYLLGMNIDEITAAICKLEFIEHRLQLIKTNGVNIIDDGYNSNVKGARAALEVLGYFGGRKIVVTPGLVELGVLEESENFSLGKNLVGFDKVILVGDTLVMPVKRGYEAGGGVSDNLVIKPTLDEARAEIQSFITKGDTVLFLNDLPDIY